MTKEEFLAKNQAVTNELGELINEIGEMLEYEEKHHMSEEVAASVGRLLIVTPKLGAENRKNIGISISFNRIENDPRPVKVTDNIKRIVTDLGEPGAKLMAAIQEYLAHDWPEPEPTKKRPMMLKLGKNGLTDFDGNQVTDPDLVAMADDLKRDLGIGSEVQEPQEVTENPVTDPTPKAE